VPQVVFRSAKECFFAERKTTLVDAAGRPDSGRVMSLPQLPTLTDDAVAVGALLALMAGAFLLRSVWLRLLGPVFVYEADRTARPGRTFTIRVFYVLALLVVIYLTHPRVKVITIDPNFDNWPWGRWPNYWNDSVVPSSVQRVMTLFAVEFSNLFLIA